MLTGASRCGQKRRYAWQDNPRVHCGVAISNKPQGPTLVMGLPKSTLAYLYHHSQRHPGVRISEVNASPHPMTEGGLHSSGVYLLGSPGGGCTKFR